MATFNSWHVQKSFENSWLYRELYEARNIRPAFKWGNWLAYVYAGLSQYIFKGREPWTLIHGHSSDAGSLKPAAQFYTD